MMTPLRVGVIGLGVGEQHIAGYQKSKGCRVTALCDISNEKLAMSRAKYPGMRLTMNPGDILANPNIDVVSIASFDETHFSQTMSALANGKHVFVEKPMCRSEAELAAVKKTWLKYNGRVKLASNLVLRAAPLYRWLRKEVQSGRFGRLYAIDADYLYGRLEKITTGWRRKTPDYSVMEGGGIHLIDLILWITGQLPTHVFSLGNRICSEGTKFRYNDFVASSFRFSSSLVGRVTANFGCVHRHHHALRIFGTKRTFIYDDAGARIHTSRDPKKVARRVALSPLPKSKGGLIPDFISSIIEERDTRGETQLFFDGIAIARAAGESVKSKKEERIKYI